MVERIPKQNRKEEKKGLWRGVAHGLLDDAWRLRWRRQNGGRLVEWEWWRRLRGHKVTGPVLSS